VSELKICRKNIFGKLVVVLNRKMCVCVYIYIYIYTHTHTHTYTFADLGKFQYLYVPQINDQLLMGNWCIFYPSEAERGYNGFGVTLITHIHTSRLRIT